jgi:hypothetical protein
VCPCVCINSREMRNSELSVFSITSAHCVDLNTTLLTLTGWPTQLALCAASHFLRLFAILWLLNNVHMLCRKVLLTITNGWPTQLALCAASRFLRLVAIREQSGATASHLRHLLRDARAGPFSAAPPPSLPPPTHPPTPSTHPLTHSPPSLLPLPPVFPSSHKHKTSDPLSICFGPAVRACVLSYPCLFLGVFPFVYVYCVYEC